MLCENCRQRESLVHLTESNGQPDEGNLPSKTKELHLCRNCADAFFANTPGRNCERQLITLSNWYRSMLYEQLEKTHPEVFDNRDREACIRGSELMIKFLRKQLKRDNIQVKGDAFEMLCLDLFCSYHFYDRINEIKNRKR